MNDFNWVRVKLSNGTQGYIANKYLTELGDASTPAPSNAGYKLATIKCDEGSSVRIRSESTTSSSVVTKCKRGTTVTVMQESVAQANGYTWDKIVTSEGLEGFVANQYLDKGGNSSNNNTSNNQVKGDLDGDGKVDSGDLYDIVAGLKNDMSFYSNSADINKDGVVDAEDIYLLIMILKQ